MFDEKFKIVLFTSLMSALVLSFGIADIYAELSPETKAKAVEGAEIWKELEKEKTDVDQNKIDQLTKDFKKIQYELNKEGIASAKQYEDNLDYWRSLSHPPYPDELLHEVHLQPWSHYSLKKSGSIDWFSTHTVSNNFYSEIQHSQSVDFTSSYVRPSYAPLHYSWIVDVPRNSAHVTTAGAYALD